MKPDDFSVTNAGLNRMRKKGRYNDGPIEGDARKIVNHILGSFKNRGFSIRQRFNQECHQSSHFLAWLKLLRIGLKNRPVLFFDSILSRFSETDL